MKRLTVVLAAIALINFPGVSFAVTYPKPAGYVNDFANIIPVNVRRDIENKLRQYKEKTSIEIVVVTVSSLEGRSVEDYTIGLARNWGIGDKQKNNGVVLLVAPSERKMRIETGYGLEADLTDSQAGSIIRDQIIPYFKQGRMADGIVAGISGIVLELGEKPYKTRLEERKAVEEKRKISEAKSAEEFKNFLTIAGIVIAIVVVVFVIGFSIRSLLRRKEKIKAFHRNNAELLRACGDMIVEAEKEYPSAQKKLEALKKDNPKEVWIDLLESLTRLPESLKQSKKYLEEMKVLNGRGSKTAEDVYGKISVLFQSVKTSSELLETITAKIIEVDKARKDGPSLLKSFPKEVEKTKDRLAHPDVSDKTKKLLEEARAKYNVAKSLSDNQAVNWILILSVLSAGAAFLAKAASAASSDKAEAEERRRPKPKPRPAQQPSSRRRSSDDSGYSSSSIWSSGSSSSSSSSDSGGFGGFGGGGFGGGGASGSW